MADIQKITNPSAPIGDDLKTARRRIAIEVEGDSDNPLRVARANAILRGERDDDYPELRALKEQERG